MEKNRLPKFRARQRANEDIRNNKALLISFETSIINDISTFSRPIFIYNCKPDKAFFDELRSLNLLFNEFSEFGQIVSLLSPHKVEFSMKPDMKSRICVRMSESVDNDTFNSIVALKKIKSNINVLYSTIDNTLILERDDRNTKISTRESEGFILESQI